MHTIIIGSIATGVILCGIDCKYCTARDGGQLTVCPPCQKLTLTVYSHSLQQRGQYHIQQITRLFLKPKDSYVSLGQVATGHYTGAFAPVPHSHHFSLD